MLIATLVPLFAVMFALRVHDGLTTGAPFSGVQVSSAASASDFPVVEQVLPSARIEGPPLQVGDRVLRVAGRSLEGSRTWEFLSHTSSEARRRAGVVLEIARGEERFVTTLFSEPRWLWWASAPFALALALTGLIVLLRAPGWPVSRRFFLTTFGIGICYATDQGRLGVAVPGAAAISVAAFPIGIGAAVSTFWEFTASARPLPAWARLQPWLFGLGVLGARLGMYLLPRPGAGIGWRAYLALQAVAIVSMLGGLTRAYRLSDALERRQIRWVLYGLYLALLPAGALLGAAVLGVPRATADLPWAMAQLSLTAAPLGVLVAVLGYRFLDIDRVISATSSYTILGVILLAVALQLIPRVAEAASSSVGMAPATGQWALSLGFAALAVLGHRRLRPWLDQRLFAQRVAVEEGLARLAVEIGHCGSVQELTGLWGERIDGILRPDSVVVYAREQVAFTPVFARGRAVPPAFAAESPLVRTLESRTAPLVAAGAPLDPHDAAALATLGAEVVTPMHRGEALVAFTCLGRKRSGDIYTPAELALLAALAGASEGVLQRLGDAELLEQARAMQANLRRYVPGAIAEQIESGRDLQAGEREVSVFFVDLRGYTSFAEKRAVEDVFSTVNEHTQRVSRIVRARGGAVVEFNGDGMMAVFGAPEAIADKERRAVEAAREIVETSPPELPVGIGIATGPVYAGNIRASDRWIWSVLGDTTNRAARLQVLTRELEAWIATDEATCRAAGSVCADFVRHTDVPLRGRSQRVDVFSLGLRRAPGQARLGYRALP